LLISAISVMEDARKAVSMDLKQPGNSLYIVGLTKNEMGGSHYFEIQKASDPAVPTVDAENALRIFTAVSEATSAGLVRACHDCSEGGIGVTIAEMAFAGGYGAQVSLQKIPKANEVTRNDSCLFSESNSRFIVEVTPESKDAFEEKMEHVPFSVIGRVDADKTVLIRGLDDQIIVQENIDNLKESWQKTLRWS